MPDSLFTDLLTLNFWFEQNPGTPSFLFQVFAVTLAVEFAVLVFASHRIDKMRTQLDAYTFKLYRRALGVAGLFISVALLLAITRFLSMPIVSTRAILGSVILVGIGLASYFFYFMNFVYPNRIEVLMNRTASKRYLPKPKPSGTKTRNRDKKKRRK